MPLLAFKMVIVSLHMYVVNTSLSATYQGHWLSPNIGKYLFKVSQWHAV